MRKWNVLKALLSKELQHNRGYFLVALVLLIYVPVLKSLFYLLQGGKMVFAWGEQLSYMLYFYQLPVGPPPIPHNDLHYPGIIAAILLGALLLGEERKGSLSYLVTTPVSRRDIVLSKFLVGSITLLLAMGINTVFLISLSGSLGLNVDLMIFLRWGLIMGLGLVCIFTLSLFTSTFTSAVLPAAGLSFLLIYLPGALIAMLENIAARYFHASQSFSIKTLYLGEYLTITDYLTGDHWSIIHDIDHFADWRMYSYSSVSGPSPQLYMETIPLLLAILLLLGFAVIVLQRISLDEQGALFASPGTRRLFIGLGGLLFAYILAFPLCSTLILFLIWTIGIIIAFYGLGEYLPRRLRKARTKPSP